MTLLTVADVARLTQLGETAARDLLRVAGGFKLGGVWRLWPQDLDRYFDLAQMMAMFSWLSPATAQRYIHLYGSGWEDMAKKLDERRG